MTRLLDAALAVALVGVSLMSAWTAAHPWIARRQRDRDPVHPHVSLVLAPHALLAAAALALLAFGASPPFGATRATAALAVTAAFVAAYVPLVIDLARARRRGRPPTITSGR